MSNPGKCPFAAAHGALARRVGLDAGRERGAEGEALIEAPEDVEIAADGEASSVDLPDVAVDAGVAAVTVEGALAGEGIERVAGLDVEVAGAGIGDGEEGRADVGLHREGGHRVHVGAADGGGERHHRDERNQQEAEQGEYRSPSASVSDTQMNLHISPPTRITALCLKNSFDERCY